MGRCVFLQGEKVSGGIGIGKLFFVDRKYSKIPHLERNDEEILVEIKRFNAAVKNCDEELSKILSQRDLESETVFILEAHRMMLTDPELSKMVCAMMRKSKINAEWAVLGVFERLISTLNKKGVDYYVKAKISDLEIIRDKLISELMGAVLTIFDELPKEDFIVCSKNLTINEVNLFAKNPNLKGIVLEAQGGVSHLTMVLRALEIPTVMGATDLIRLLDYGDTIIVDGFKGEVVLRPTKLEIERAFDKKQNFETYFAKFLENVETPSVSTDGIDLQVGGNIEQSGEIEFVKKYGGEFIGLFRTEMMFSRRYEIPTEEQHFEVYNQILHRALPMSATIRIFDFGEDKSGAIVTKGFMGMRGIRLCKTRAEVFDPQIRALIRAAKYGNLNILLPFVSAAREVDSFKELLYKTARAMGMSENVKNVKIGAMIEVPAAVFIAEHLAKEVDFFSVGTNDLIQYLMAVERKDESSSEYFSHYYPAIIRVLYNLADVAKSAGIPVTICGEMARDPYFPLVFLAMGISSLSMIPTAIPIIKKIIKSGSFSEGKEILQLLLSAKDKKEVVGILHAEMTEKCPGIFNEDWDNHYKSFIV